MKPRFLVYAIVVSAMQSCVTYQPHVLNPVRSQQRLQQRDPGAAATLDLNALIEIGLRLHPDLDVARAKAEVAAAGVITARQRINPSFSGDGGYNKTPDSTSTYSVSAAFTIETAGKRGYRILEAEKSAEAAGIAVYEAEWQVRSAIRKAAVEYYAAAKRLEQLQMEDGIKAEIVQIFAKRVALGEAAQPALDAARAERALGSVQIRNTTGAVSQALSTIAASVGVPVAALESKTLDFSAFDAPPSPEALPLLRVQQSGLLHRADVRRMLVQYEVADAHLRLAVAQQYPNISLNPAYAFQEGFPAYTLGSIIDSVPLFHHNQGQIAEAEAARRQAEAEFVALQSRVISETELALRQYTAAIHERNEARDGLESMQRHRENNVVAQVAAGESDRFDVAQARLNTAAANSARLEASIRAQAALSALEDAVQSSLTGVTTH